MTSGRDGRISAAQLRVRLRTAWGLAWSAGALLTLAQLAITLLGGVLVSAVTWSTKIMIDGLVDRAPLSVLVGAVAVIAIAGLVRACAPEVSTYLRAELDRRVELRLNDRLFTAVGSFQGLARFEDPRILDRIRQAQQARQAVGDATIGPASVAGDVIAVAGLLVTVYLLAPPMAAILLVAAVPVLFAEVAQSRRFAAAMETMSQTGRRQFELSALNSDVRAVKEIRLLGLVPFFKARILAAVATAATVQRDLDRRQMRSRSLLALLSTVISTGGLAWAVAEAYQGRLSIGDVSAFAAAVAGLQGALGGLVSRISRAHRALVNLGPYVDVVTMDADLPQPARAVELPPLRSGIDLVDVWFRYAPDQPWILQGLTTRITAGEAMALVGLNGAGKSTLIKLLCRFYDPDRGAILWDGVDIRDVAVPALRRRIGVLFQDFMEYDLTAAQNIGVGDVDAIDDEGRVAAAARSAGIAAKIESLPRRYGTMLSRIFFREGADEDPEQGVSLSGGQWQRVALARTFMRENRDLLILDEPSSGLDAEAEHEIHRSLGEHRAGRTSVLVSHRLSSVRDADRIVVLADGRIVEEGAHRSLMDLDGQYARLFRLQARGYTETPA
ncbi:ABC transporter ATP-binding protein [Pseudonocardia sp. CA-107938]|uniref:ABC transporter ATP-binding protein n=1 Tax=Pseudonocardia sp. CA-107938 TaxID=3240021 RepID=UPI003D91DF82